MKSRNTCKVLMVIFCVTSTPNLAKATGGKPSVIKMNFMRLSQLVADTTIPAKDEKTSEKKDDNNDRTTDKDQQVEVVKVIPKARRQPIPVPVKVNVQPVKIIKPKIIRPVVKPVIKILH